MFCLSQSRKSLYALQVFLLLGCIIFPAGEVRAQVAGATLSGTVTDSNGTVIPQAKVSIKNVATGIVVDVAANSDGLYSAPNLLPGTYQVLVSASGFATLERSGVTLTVGAQQVLNLSLRVGKLSEKIVVTGEAPAVELGTSEISENVSERTMRELPLNGRDWSQLATLQPGIETVRTPVSLQNNGTARGLGATLTISGNRPNQNNYRLDGISVNDYSNSAPGSVLGQNLGVDAIQEFSVLSSNYSAEYGKTSGGVVNAITKSGTSQVHGTAYEFLRNSALDARNFFDVGGVPPFRRNQFGGSIGGPIKKDRLFIFGDYEGLRQSLSTTTQDFVPSATARAGTLHYDPTGTPPSGCTVTVTGTCTVTVDPQVLRFTNAFFPLPNAGLLGAGDTGLYKFARNQVVPQNYMTTKIDYNLSPKDTLFGTYLYDSSTLTQPDEFNNKIEAFQAGRQSAVLEETHIITPQLANTLRLGYSRSRAWGGLTQAGANPAATDPSYGSIPGMTAAQVTVPSLTAFSGGVGAPSNQKFDLNAYQVYDDAFLTKGNHALKFGFAYERDQNNMLTHLFPDGQANFGSLSSYLQGQAQSFTAILPTVPITPRDMRQSIVGTYFQDDWRLRPNLTLNLGMRYEMATVPTEEKGRLSRLLTVTDSQPFLGSPFFSNPTLRNFEPRVGFAWDPFRTGKTSVRGGFGMFDALPLTYQNWETTFASAPFTENGTATGYGPNAFPSQVFSAVNGVPSTFAQEFIEAHPHRNYVMQWNLNVQRQLTNDLSILVGYVGSHSVHNPFLNDDINIVLPTLTPQGYAWPLPIGSGTVTNPNVGQIRTYQWKSSASFNGLETQVTKKMGHGVQIQGSYTWSKTIDTSSASRAEDQFNNSFAGLPFWDNRLNRGLADFNVGQNVVINFTWMIPAPKVKSQVVELIAGGWQFGGVFEASSGVPFFMNLGGDPTGQNNSDPFDVPNRLGGPGCSSLVNPGNPTNYVKLQCLAFPNPVNIRGNLGRNTMIGPGLVNTDLSIIKNFPVKRISEAFNMQFRTEFFNAFNRVNFAPPLDNLTAFDQFGNPVPGAGQIDSTQTPSRQIQFGLKVIW
ncbi:MAG TPA: carboxypeptidase regulatory-like domain-containing protein [Candidatus Sulfotelmatobacter sp.]|jgi:outer membrane receptor protein involved in Fe transport|nr:carboxypeptidase regulatory-like domain-containing protein [Candidatus Sulfotelmatobacter sp.]